MKKIVLFFNLAALFAYTSCQKNHEEAHEQVKFVATSPFICDTTITQEYVCQIHSIQHIELRALEKGYLQKIYVDEGQIVKEGQLMFQIMPVLYNAELQRAKAEADLAEIEYRNTKALADSNIVSKNELAMAKARLDKAKAEVSLAAAHLGFTEIRAPFTGIMDRFQVRLGSLVDEGELTSLSDNSKMWIYFNVPEAEYLEIKSQHKSDKGLPVQLKMANNQVFDQQGVIETIEADFNNETGNIAFRATFPNPEGLLRHGETGNILMDIPFRNARIIPQKATFEILEKKYVFVIDQNNVVHQREVKIGGSMPDLFIISGGLKNNEKILLEGIRKVKDGDKIKFEFQDPSQVIPKLNVYVE